MPVKNPPHPGEIIRDLYIEPLALTITAAAAGLGVTRKTLSTLINGHASISPEMAFRLSKAFGRSPEGWLRLQNQYDLAQIQQKAEQLKITPFVLRMKRFWKV
ncbi:HigA family addiction module antidote protein [Chloroflexi bacterium TSY]|nr:HigA family addiction module antidote protein [Chloroflexi bacterium TSY]